MTSETYVQLVKPNHPQAGDIEFATADEALAFLKEASKRKRNRLHFENIFEQIRAKRDKDREVTERKRLAELSDKLAKGSLRIRRIETTGGGDSDVYEPPAPSPRQAWVVPVGMKIRERPDPPPPPEPEPPLELDQQVAVLLSAAKSGVPFCEQCHGSDETEQADHETG